MGETVQSYAHDIATLFLSLDVPDEEHFHVFVQGLIPPLKEHVLCHQPDNIEQALRMAVAKECAMQAISTNLRHDGYARMQQDLMAAGFLHECGQIISGITFYRL